MRRLFLLPAQYLLYILLAALDAGADDVQDEGEESVIYTDPKQLAVVRGNLQSAGIEILEAELNVLCRVILYQLLIKKPLAKSCADGRSG